MQDADFGSLAYSGFQLPMRAIHGQFGELHQVALHSEFELAGTVYRDGKANIGSGPCVDVMTAADTIKAHPTMELVKSQRGPRNRTCRAVVPGAPVRDGVRWYGYEASAVFCPNRRLRRAWNERNRLGTLRSCRPNSCALFSREERH